MKKLLAFIREVRAIINFVRTLGQHQRNWYNTNAELGRELGYPECCIKEFGNFPPELLNWKYFQMPEKDKQRYEAGCKDFSNFTGFIPCRKHAQQILDGKINLQSLIKDRNPFFPPFPNY